MATLSPQRCASLHLNTLNFQRPTRTRAATRKLTPPSAIISVTLQGGNANFKLDMDGSEADLAAGRAYASVLKARQSILAVEEDQVAQVMGGNSDVMHRPESSPKWKDLVTESANAWEQAALATEDMSRLIQKSGNADHGNAALKVLNGISFQGMDPGIERAMKYYTGVTSDIEVLHRYFDTQHLLCKRMATILKDILKGGTDNMACLVWEADLLVGSLHDLMALETFIDAHAGMARGMTVMGASSMPAITDWASWPKAYTPN